MLRPAVFFDRDNTLIRNSGYLRNPREVVLLHGAAQAVADCRAMGFATVTVSNQSGVARAMMSERDVMAVNAKMDELLTERNAAAVFDDHYFCPYHPDPAVASVKRYCKESDLRKPAPGMLLLAAEEHGLDLGRSWMIGDAARDMQAGIAAGCRCVLVRSVEVEASPHATQDDGGAEYVASDLAEAVAYIRDHADKLESPAPPPEPMNPTTNVADEVEPDAAASNEHLQQPLREILQELRAANMGRPDYGFSVTKLLAGVTQVLALALLFLAFMIPEPGIDRTNWLLTAVFVQMLTGTLLWMER